VKAGASLRLDGDDIHIALAPACYPPDQPAAAHGNDDCVDRGGLIDDLTAQGSLTGHDLGLVIGVRLECPGLLDKAPGGGEGIVVEVSGTKIVARYPRRLAAWATASPKLPPEAAAMPPTPMSPVVSSANAPRGLNDPVTWRCSSFSVKEKSADIRLPTSIVGVRRMCAPIRLAAASISRRVTSLAMDRR